MKGSDRAGRGRIALGIGAAALAVVLIAIAAFPYGALRGTVEDRLRKRFGRAVTIEALERQDRFGFTPNVAIRGLRIAQADWAGQGDLARVDRVVVRFPVWPLMIGRFRPRSIVVEGARLDLVRDRRGRTNWEAPGGSSGGRGGGMSGLGALTVRDALVRYRDAKQDRAVAMRLSSDAAGVRVDGRGTIRGAPVSLALRGGPIAGHEDQRWPIRVLIDGPALRMAVTGTTDRPLDAGAMTLAIDARARDLKLVDAVIEAGLFGTQPVSLAAQVRRESRRWIVTGLRGTIGRSDIMGHVTVDQRGERTVIDGEATSRRLDFDDLSSDEGLAKAAALEARIGKRLVPNTRINLSHMTHTDGRLGFRIARIVSRKGASTLQAMRGTLALDRQRLTIAPFALALTRGAITGTATVDQRGGAVKPLLRLDLRLRGSSIAALAGDGGGQVDAPVAAHVRLVGRGDTIREAVGRASGRVGLVARSGVLPARYAAAIGFDAGRAAFEDGAARAGLRCVVLRMPVRGGRGTLAPLVIDTTQSQAHGTGSISFPAEALAITLTGEPKGRGVLRLSGPAQLGGSIRDPHLALPPRTRSAGSIFKAIGRAITGDHEPRAGDADCAGLAARALE